MLRFHNPLALSGHQSLVSRYGLKVAYHKRDIRFRAPSSDITQHLTCYEHESLATRGLAVARPKTFINQSFSLKTTILQTMTTKDTTLQSDITKMKLEKDGSFKRLDASFRNVIEKGGRFEPEAGRGFS
jgi:hypothetical protein